MLISKMMKRKIRNRNLEIRLAVKMRMTSMIRSNYSYRSNLLLKNKLHLAIKNLRKSLRECHILVLCHTIARDGWVTLPS
jgi:hypothetical protein